MAMAVPGPLLFPKLARYVEAGRDQRESRATPDGGAGLSARSYRLVLGAERRADLQLPPEPSQLSHVPPGAQEWLPRLCTDRPAAMALGLLWLSLTLLGALQTQAQDSAPNLIPAPPLTRVPLQRNFRADQFQGKWYVVGLAGNAVSQTEDGQFTMYTTNYELKEDGSYNVTSTLLRNQTCDYFVRTFVRTSRPGQFRLGNIRAYPGLQRYTVRVVATDYTQSAMVFFKKVFQKRGYFKVTLYGRTKELPQELKENFSRFAKSLGLADDNIVYPVPIDTCIDDE